jgi:hypothetical protein
MTLRGFGCTVFGALGCLALVGCVGAESDGVTEDAIDTNPASLAEGQAAMDTIDRIMAESGSTDALVQKERLIRDRMETLAGRVDRIEVAPGHTINFFLSPEGSILVGERMKIGTPSAMKGHSSESIESLYTRLAPGRTIPAALAHRPLVETGDLQPTAGQQPREAAASAAATALPPGSEDIEVASSALTSSAEDDQWFRDNACLMGNVSSFCAVHVSTTRLRTATSDHSQVWAAFTSGTGSIRLNWGRGTGDVVSWNVSVLPDELVFFWWVGAWTDVRDAGCLPWPFACGTHREAQKRTTFWSTSNITASKVYDLGGMFYNDPLNWNSP